MSADNSRMSCAAASLSGLSALTKILVSEAVTGLFSSDPQVVQLHNTDWRPDAFPNRRTATHQRRKNINHLIAAHTAQLLLPARPAHCFVILCKISAKTPAYKIRITLLRTLPIKCVGRAIT